MTRRDLGPLLEIDPKIERSLLARRREIHQQLREPRDPFVTPLLCNIRRSFRKRRNRTLRERVNKY